MWRISRYFGDIRYRLKCASKTGAGVKVRTILNRLAFLLCRHPSSFLKRTKSWKVQKIIEMVVSYEKKLAQSSLKLPLKSLRFLYNNQLLTPYGCPEFMFVSGARPGVRTITLAKLLK